MDTNLHEIDARALRLGLTLSALAERAGVSSSTMAKLRKGESVRPRPVNKLIATLEEMERAA